MFSLGDVMDVSQAIQGILIKILQNARLQLIMITDSTGLVLSQVSREAEDIGLEGIGALASALYSGMQEQGGGMMRMGPLDIMISEFAAGKLVMQGVAHDYVLIGVTHPRASIQKVRNVLKRYNKKIAGQIQLLRTSQFYEQIKTKEEFEGLEDALKELDFRETR